MPVNAKGRYVPPRKPKSESPPVPLYEQYGIDLRVPMPWWYPVMSFQAAVGRQVLEGDDGR